MHKRKLKRNTLTQSVKTPENSSRLRDYQDNQNESSDYFQLPSLQKKKTWKDVDDNASTWDQNSAATDIFCSSEIENIATKKIIQQWEAVENTLYEDGEQVTQPAILEECIQWRTQIPHLRVTGKNPFLSTKTNHEDVSINCNQMRNSSEPQNEDAFSEYSLSLKDKNSSSKHKLQNNPEDEIFDVLYEHVISELFPNKENEIDSLGDSFNDVLQIRMAPIHSNKSSAKSTKLNWFEEANSLENRFSNNSDKAIESRTIIKRESAQIQKKYDNVAHNNRRSEKDEYTMLDKLFRPHTSRNKLGTVFNEKIVVSPVPYVLSTRESFSTVKTTPIKFMAQSLEVSTFQGIGINYFKKSGKKSPSAKISNYQSAWHAPVSSAVWPKNIKLAPLDTSRLPSSKNRFLTSSVPLPRNRKPLSPISRPTLPVSAQTVHNNNNEGLEIQGRHIVSGQSSKLNTLTTGLKNAGGAQSKRRKSQQKIKS
ncbi:hypothetical protein WH47_02466 [Habropoda laboriosa]|uniref:DUF3719 domain-containing protein n=1 Tax=Habropoda laboriosa TaxID=597456 RepID=A0A0L7QWM9_9HYME|nr:hypothetical protein WH47_02466 [Habropoda laboriosa]